VNETTIAREAMTKAQAERAAFLDQVCAGNPGLRERVEVAEGTGGGEREVEIQALTVSLFRARLSTLRSTIGLIR